MFIASRSWAAYGFNKSVDGDTILETCDKKQKQLRDFKSGDYVYGVDEQGQMVENKVVALHDHGMLPGYCVEFSDGYSVVVSIDHKFLTSEGQRPLWDIVERKLAVLCEPSFRIVNEVRSTDLPRSSGCDSRTPEELHLLSREEAGEYSSEDDHTQSIRNTASGIFQGSKEDLGSSRHSITESGKDPRLAEGKPGKNSLRRNQDH